MANETKQIAQFIARLTYDDIPEEVIKRAKIVMLDTLSCAVAGYTKSKEECEWAIKIAKEWGGNEEASIWCDGFKASAMAAAFANATMVHTVDFDDTHIDSISHFGAGLLATVLALAEKTKANGKEMITAFIAGFEAAARTGNSVNKGAVHHHYKYWHPTATCGTIGCAAAAAKMYKLNELETEYALGLGIDQASGLRYCVDKGDYSKSCLLYTSTAYFIHTGYYNITQALFIHKAFRKSEIHQRSHDAFFFRQCDKTVSYISYGDYPHIVAKTARTASIIGDSYDSCYVFGIFF